MSNELWRDAVPVPVDRLPSFESLVIADDVIEDVIRMTPGVIVDCWAVMTDEQPPRVLHLTAGDSAEHLREASIRAEELCHATGKSIITRRATGKFVFDIARVELECAGECVAGKA